MSCCGIDNVNNITIQQGRTYRTILRWETAPIIYKAITGVTQTAPVSITAVGHGLTNGWRVAVASVKGMTQLNTDQDVLESGAYTTQATVKSADTVEINTINAAEYKPYTSGGYLQYNTPMDLTGFTARMAIKNKVGGDILATLTTENGGITVNNTTKQISLFISALASSAFTWTKGVYDLEMVSTTGEVTAVSSGTVTVTKEVTT